MARDDVQRAMSDERLAEINSLTADVVAGRIHARFDEETAWLAILDARREVERLRAALDAQEQREAALLAVVRAVAKARRVYSAPGDMVGLPPSMKNRAATLIVPIDLQEQARALLASAGDGEQADNKQEQR